MPPPSYAAVLWPGSAILGNFELLEASWSIGLQNQGQTPLATEALATLAAT
jgi:hypothetical protein